MEEHVRCNLCGSDNQKLLFDTHKLHDGKRGGIVRCRRCGLVYRNIRQKDSISWENYQQQDYSNLSEDWIAGRKNIFSNCMDSLEVFRQHNRILDVGAGHGFFLQMCADRGWDCYGVEISRSAVDFAQREFGLSLSCSSLEQAHYPDEFFDVVTFWNVLDHLPNPKRTLQETQRVLRSGGAVIVRCPNAAFHVPVRRVFTLSGHIHKTLKSIDPSVSHLYSFDKKSISHLLRESGFTKVKISNAYLSWTTRHDARIGLVIRITCRLAFELARFFRCISFGKLVLSPSLLAIATKLPNKHS
ncbi:class I SAM-dependent methyltransferase [Verrucomicrobiota bacterium]